MFLEQEVEELRPPSSTRMPALDHNRSCALSPRECWGAAFHMVPADTRSSRLLTSFDRILRRLLPWVLVTSGPIIALCVTARILVAPQWDWNAARLAFGFALARGFDLYPISGSGPLPGCMYGPVVAAAYLPAVVFRSPTIAVLAGAALAVGYVLVPAFLLLRRWVPRSPYGWVSLVVLAGTCLVSGPLRYSTFSIHADAPLLGLLTGAAGLWCATSPRRGVHIVGAFLVAAALWCKQNAAPVVLVFPLWSLLVSGSRASLRALLLLGVTLVAFSLAAVSHFGFRALVFNLITIPAAAPWYGSGTALERLVPVFFDYVRLTSLWWLGLAVLTSLHWNIARATPQTWRQWLRQCPWLLLALEGAILAPTSILAKVRVGGGVNSWTPALFFLVLACLGATLDLASRFGQRGLTGSAAVFARALLLSLCVGLGLHEALGPDLQDIRRDHVRHPFTNPQQQAHDYLVANPGSVYFPWNPLAHLMAESRLVHYADGIITRASAGFPISQAEFEAGVGRTFVYVAAAPTRRNEWVQEHHLSEFSQRVELPGLPGWTVYQAPLAQGH